MTREEAIQVLSMVEAHGTLVIQAKEMAIEALRQKPCEDCVSALNRVMEYTYGMLTAEKAGLQHLIKSVLDDLPSVTPQKPCEDCQYKEWLEGEDCSAYEKKTGHWILTRTFPTKLYDEYLKEYECSECYRRIRCTESQLVNYPYCHCGSKMVEPQESEKINCKTTKCENCQNHNYCDYEPQEGSGEE